MAERPAPGLRAICRLLASYHCRHAVQGLTLFFGLVCGTALWVSLQQVNAEARQSYALADQLLGNEITHWIESSEGIPLAAYVALRRDGWRSVFPIVERRFIAANGEPFTLLATDVLALSGSASRASAERPWPALLTAPYQAWVPENLASKLGLAEGRPLLTVDGYQLPEIAIAQWSQQGQRVFVDLAAIAELLTDDTLDYLGVRLENADQAERLQASLPPALRLTDNTRALDLEKLTASLHVHLDALGLLAFAVGLFIVMGAARIALQARGQILLTARLLGARNRDIGLAVLIECFILALLAAGAGILLGNELAARIIPALSTSLQGLYGATLEPSGKLPLMLLPGALLLGFSGLMLAVALPLRHWLGAAPIVLLQTRRRAQGDLSAWRRAALAALFVLPATLLAYPWAPTIQTVFVLLGITLWASAALLPLLLTALIRGAAHCWQQRSLAWRWLWADAQAQLPSLRLGLAALLLTVAATIGVDTMVASFRGTLDSWLAQRLSADLYLQTDPMRYAGLSETLDTLSTTVHRRNGLTVRADGQPVLIRGLQTDAPDTRTLPLAAQRTDWLEAWYASEPGYVLINEQTGFRAAKRVGDLLTVMDGLGQQQELRIAGVFYDYGNPNMQWYLPYRVVAQLWPEAAFQGAGLWLKPDSARDSVENVLRSAGLHSAEWVWQDTLRTASRALFDRTFAVTATMGSLLLALGISATLFAHGAVLSARTQAFQLWRALGVSEHRRLLLAAAPTALCAAMTCLLAAPLGLLITWLLIRYVNVLGFGWTMPVQPTLAAVATPILFGGAAVASVFATALLQQRRQLSHSAAPMESSQ